MSEKTKHTPGPWRTGSTPLDGDCVISDAGIVAEVVDGAPDGFTPVEFFANASLIAAAPELLAVCTELVEGYAASDIDLQSLAREAEAAIAKARGEA